MSKSAYFLITVDYFFCHVFLILEHAHLIFKMSCNQLPRAFCQYCTEATDVCTIHYLQMLYQSIDSGLFRSLIHIYVHTLVIFQNLVKIKGTQ